MKITTIIGNKKLISLFLFTLLIMVALGTHVNAFGKKNRPLIQDLVSFETTDELDQQQNNYNASTCLLGSALFAQSFEPTFETLTRVKLFMNKIGDLYGNSILSIRESLTGNDLTSVTKESLELNSELSWVEFDFPDIQVNPGDSYYIILKPDPDSDGGNGFTYISWAFGWKDYYLKGAPYQKIDGSWGDGITAHQDADYTFRTYGVDTPNEGEIEIEVYVGLFHQDMGMGITIDVFNHKDHNVSIYFNQSFDYIFNYKQDSDYPSVRSIPSDRLWRIRSSLPPGMKRVFISVECEGTNVYREGFSINDFIILT